MKVQLTVYKEVRTKANAPAKGFPDVRPLQEPLQGILHSYRCRMTYPAGSRVWNMSADSIRTLREAVDRMIAGLPDGTVIEEVCCRPPEGSMPRAFIVVRDRVPLLRPDGKPVNKRYTSSGTMMIANPVPLDENERKEFEAPA